MANLSGKELGNYRIGDRIDRGGMAEVYRGVHTNLDRQVAIKVLHGHLLEGGDFLARFKREAKAVANLRHPNIVQVYDFDVQDEIIFMVMEYIDGTNLQKRLVALEKEGERLSISQTGSIINDIAGALDYAHSKGMLHRDVKPSNILLDKDDKAFLTDFGIAKILSDQKFTATGTLIGTPAYMSPEQGSGEELTEESDIYSLGVVAFEMITGQVPYDAQTPIGIVHKQIAEPIPDISELVDDVPGPTQEVIDTALAKSPDERYSSAEALVIALRGALQALETSDATVIMVPDVDTVVDEEVQSPTVEMKEETLQATVIMDEEDLESEPEELVLPEAAGEALKDVEGDPGRKIPVWGYILGGIVLVGIVGVVLSRVGGFGSSTTAPDPTQASQDPEPTVVESVPAVEIEFDGRTAGGANPQTSNGMTVFLEAGGDADIELVLIDGGEAWRTGNARILPSPDGNTEPDFYMIIDVDDGFIYQGGPTSEVLIEVEYLDEGTDQFRIEYDAVSGGPDGNGKYSETDWVKKTNSGDYKIAVFELEDANFANRTHGGDFRINDNSDGFETIRSVSVTLPSMLGQ